MTLKIVDGRGGGHQSGVTDAHRLLVEAVSIPSVAQAAREGKTFVVWSGNVSLLAADGESALFYIENTGNVNIVWQWSVLSGTANAIWRLYGGVTGGTLVTGGTTPVFYNMNSGSARTMTATAKGASASGQTVTGGANASATRTAAHIPFRHNIQGAIILAPGATFAVTVEPDANGDFNFETFVNLTLEEGNG